MNLTPTLGRLKTGTYTVTRSTAGEPYGSDGRAATPATSTFQVTGPLLPVSGRDLKHLPEGQRAEESRAFWSPVLLLGAGPSQSPDRLSAGGETWQVQTVFDRNDLGKFWKVILVKV